MSVSIRVPVVAAVFACWASLAPSTARAEIGVVTTIKPIHSLVAGVLGNLASPTVLVQGNASPHTFSLKPSDAAAIGNADIFIRVSEELEPFTRRLIRSLPKKVRVVTLEDTPGLTLLPIRSGGAFEDHDHGHGHGHGHNHGHGSKGKQAETDGHIWLDPLNARALVLHVAKVLSEVRPQHAATFQSNAAATVAKLDALHAEIEREIAAAKGQPIAVFHDAYQYFEKRYGVSTVGSITVNPEVQPSGKRLTELRRKIAGLKAVCVMSEPQFDTKLVQAITSGSTARIGVIDPLGARIETGADHYFTMMRDVVNSIRSCAAPPA